MTLQIYNANSIGTGIRADLTTLDDVYVGADGLVGSTNDNAIEGSGAGHHAEIMGTVVAQIAALVLGDNSSVDHSQSAYVASGGQLYGLTDSAVFLYGYLSTLENHGLIKSEHSSGVRMGSSGSGTESTLDNSGMIEGATHGVNRSGSEDFSLFNSGTISGGSSAFYGFSSTGDIAITNEGLMEGIVYLGQGDDSYIEQGSGHSTRFVSGGAGMDVLTGRGGDNEFYGGDDNDVLKGGAGSDTLDGGANADKINGGSGADDILGGSGRDVIRGGGGEDTIDGGSGPDKLWGNGGRDVFVFSSTGDGEGQTVVKDFRDDFDQFDFSAYGVTFNQLKAASKTTKDGALSIKMADLGGSGKVLVNDFAKSDLDAGDLIV